MADLHLKGKWVFTILTLIFFYFEGVSNQEIIYTVLVPKLIQSNTVFKMVLYLTNLPPEDVYIQASICFSEKTVLSSNEILVRSTRTPTLLSINTGELPEISYNLVLNIKSSIENITDHTVVFTVTKQRSIILQTDKNLYKAGEVVNFRVVIVNRYLKMIEPSPTADVYIHDPEKNLIKEWANVTVSRGIWSGQLQLASDPILGEWKMKVISNQRFESLPFFVSAFIKPKFNVELKLPNYITFNSSNLLVNIKASYRFGKSVTGTCLVSLRRYYPFDTRGWEESTAVSKTVQIDGTTFVEFNVRKELSITDSFDKEFEVRAQVTEEIGGRIQEVSQTITMYKYPYKLEMNFKKDVYKPGFPLPAFIKVMTQDGHPISDSNPMALKVTHGFSYTAEGSIIYSSIPDNGWVNVTFTTPTNEFLTVSNIDVTYKELTKWFPPPRKASPSSYYLDASLITEYPTADKILEVLIQATQKMPYLYYTLVSRGRILKFDKIQFKYPTNTTILKLRLPTVASPHAQLLTGAIFPPKNVLIVDVLKFVVRPKQENFLDVTLSDTVVEPGKNVTINLHTSPFSLIALGAVEQTQLLHPDRDLTMNKLQMEMLSYMDEIINCKDWSSLPAFEAFEDAGMSLLTNSEIVKPVLNPAQFLISDAPIALARLAGSESARNSRIHNIIGTDDPKLISKIQQTWFWQDVYTETGNASLEIVAPPTMTSWVITGYSITKDKPIGVLLQPQTLKTFRQFFLSLNVPYSVIKGEILAVEIIVHNYLGEDISAGITVHNKHGGYDFVNRSFKNFTEAQKTVTVRSNEVQFVQFLVTMVKFGPVEIKVSGLVAGRAGDTVSKMIIVKRPGKLRKQSASLLIYGKPDMLTIKKLLIEVPGNRTFEADRVYVTALGDILGSVVSKLKLPFSQTNGCGEKNVVNLTLDIVVLGYLNATGKLSPETKEIVLKNLELGYQRQLTFRRFDGSFSAFGNNDRNGSTWLTAIVMRTLIAAKNYITIDPNVIEEGLAYLVEMQTTAGLFHEKGRLLALPLQDGNKQAMTAYTILTFMDALDELEDEPDLQNQYSSAVKKGLAYISSRNVTQLNPYSINLIAYCLEVANHTEKDKFFNIMESIAHKHLGLGEMYWNNKQIVLKESLNSQNESQGSVTTSHNSVGDFEDSEMLPQSQSKSKKGNQYSDIPLKPQSVEMTGYAMLTYLHKKLILKTIPMAKWLVRQMNPYGLFLSIQDTVVAFTAFAELEKHNRVDHPGLKIVKSEGPFEEFELGLKVVVKYQGGYEEFDIHKNNSIVLQEKQLPRNVQWADVAALGSGIAMVQLVMNYYVQEEDPDPAFKLNATVSDIEKGQRIQLKICAAYSRPVDSNMVVVEVTLPTGFSFCSFNFEKLRKVPKILRYETESDYTVLLLYFMSFKPGDYICFTLIGNTEYHVANQSPGHIVMYDSYDSKSYAIKFFDPPHVDVCDICKKQHHCWIGDDMCPVNTK